MASAGYSSVSLRGPGIGVGLFASVLLHVGLIAAFLTLRSRPVATPPVYNIQLLAAPTGTPAIGVVQPAPAPRFSRTAASLTTGPSKPGADTRAALTAWGIADVDGLIESGAAVED